MRGNTFLSTGPEGIFVIFFTKSRVVVTPRHKAPCALDAMPTDRDVSLWRLVPNRHQWVVPLPGGRIWTNYPGEILAVYFHKLFSGNVLRRRSDHQPWDSLLADRLQVRARAIKLVIASGTGFADFAAPPNLRRELVGQEGLDRREWIDHRQGSHVRLKITITHEHSPTGPRRPTRPVKRVG